MRDVVLDHKAHKQGGDDHTQGRQQDIQIVAVVEVDVGGEQVRNGVNEVLEYLGGEPGNYTYQEGEEYDEGALVDMALAPLQETHKQVVQSSGMYILLCHLLVNFC